jgi:hypothetical protein
MRPWCAGTTRPSIRSAIRSKSRASAPTSSWRRVFANEGRISGFNATLEAYLDDGVVVVVLANLDTQGDSKIASQHASAALH